MEPPPLPESVQKNPSLQSAYGVPHICRWISKDRWTDEWPDPPNRLNGWHEAAEERAEETRRMLREQAEL